MIKKIWTIIKELVILVIVAIIVQKFVLDICVAQGISMYPNINDNDKFIEEKITTKIHTYKRGMIITFYSDEEEKYFIKRIIGIPGDKVEIKKGAIYVNERRIKEDYLENKIVTEPEMTITVPSKHVFALGDNRGISYDSRYFGCVPFRDIRGHVLFRVYPFSFKK